MPGGYLWAGVSFECAAAAGCPYCISVHDSVCIHAMGVCFLLCGAAEWSIVLYCARLCVAVWVACGALF